MMNFQPMLDEKEWSLILQLLEHERHDAPVELRHTETPDYTNSLDDRRMMINDLIQRLQAQGLKAH